LIKLDALRGTKDEGELSSTRTNLVEVARECHNSKSFPGGMAGFPLPGYATLFRWQHPGDDDVPRHSRFFLGRN